MMKRNGRFGIVLSGVAMIGLGLSLLISEGFASSDVYLVRPDSAANSGWANTVWESFSATCDSIDSVSFFVGAEVPHKIYTAQVYDSVTQLVVWSTTRSSTGWKYQDMGFGVRKPVVRGKKYCLQLSIADSSFLPLQWNYFFRNGNPYFWGVISTGSSGRDLAARVVGIGRVLDVWGMCTYQVSSKNMDTTMNSNVMLDSCKAEGASFIREYFPWRFIQPDSTTFDWTKTDSLMILAKLKNLKVLVNLADGANWCASQPQVDTCIKSDMLPYNHPPRGLYRPVFITPDSVNPKNYFAYYVRRLVDRYGHGNPNNNWDPVEYWEIWNEENSLGAWDYPDTTDTTKGYPGIRDSVGLAALYDTLVHVAYQVIKRYDSQAKIVMGGLERVRVSGNQRDTCYHRDVSGHPFPGVWWLDKFLQDGSGQWIDVYAFHPYREYSWPPARVQVGELQKDADTLRKVLKFRGQGDKPLWANEVGYAASTACGINRNTQANNCVKFHAATIGLGANPNGPVDKLMWFDLVNFWKYSDSAHDSTQNWWAFCGTMNREDLTPNPMHYSLKQMNGKIKNKYFNRRVPLADTNVYCYEFQVPGADTMLKTWCLWLNNGKHEETLSVRTDTAFVVTRDTIGSADSVFATFLSDGSGKVKLFESQMDTVPRYLHEYGRVKRPDVVVDSVWLVKASGTGEPRAGEGTRIYARIRNIGNAVLDSTLADTVTFQVDGLTKAKHRAARGLGPKDDPNHKDTLTVGFFGVGPAPDWTATGGDHLIRAWADSADRYVELREDNNQGYLFKHFRPKVSLIINNNSKYSNHLSNNTVSVVINGNTSPNPDSTYFRHESGSWTKIPKTTTFDTLVTYSGNGVGYDSVLIFQGADTALAGDSIIVDASAPYTAITSPPDSQTVYLNAQVEFWGFSYDFEYHDSLWDIVENQFEWASDTTKVGNPLFMMPGYFGTWTAWSTGWHTHTLVSRDSATNIDTSVVHVYVNNSGGGDGDGFGAGFGSFSSSPMNVVTDPNGNLFVAETQNSKVRKYSPKKDSLFAFSARRGDTTGLNWAVGMALKDSTILYVADGYGHCVKAFDRQGNLLLRFGSIGNDTGQFKRPSGLALDWKGRLFVVDGGNNRVQVFDTTGHYLFQFGGLGSDSGKLNTPTGIAITKDKLVYITDTKNHQVQVFDSLGNWKKTIKKPDSLGFDTPTGICTDKHGNVFVADTKHHRIVELNPFGRRLFIFGTQGDSLWQFRNPIGVASSPSGHFLYVADLGNKRVTRFWVIRGDTLGGGGPQAGAVVQRLPLVYELGPAIPNPSKGQTTFRYALPKESRVNMTFYNVAGQVVREFNQGKQKAGYYSLTWDGRSNLGHRVGAGVYFYRLNAGSWVKTRKMIVIR